MSPEKDKLKFKILNEKKSLWFLKQLYNQIQRISTSYMTPSEVEDKTNLCKPTNHKTFSNSLPIRLTEIDYHDLWNYKRRKLYVLIIIYNLIAFRVQNIDKIKGFNLYDVFAIAKFRTQYNHKDADEVIQTQRRHILRDITTSKNVFNRFFTRFFIPISSSEAFLAKFGFFDVNLETYKYTDISNGRKEYRGEYEYYYEDEFDKIIEDPIPRKISNLPKNEEHVEEPLNNFNPSLT
jgi:hypothetical protein